jgi:elongation factor G
MPPVTGINPKTGEPVERHAATSEPFTALAFKLQADPFVGQLTFFRVYSGTIEAGSYIYNSTTGSKERLGRIVRLQANQREEVKKVYAGEIAAAVGLKTPRPRTRCATRPNPIILEQIKFPEPVISLAHRAQDQSRPRKDGHGDEKTRRRGPNL